MMRKLIHLSIIILSFLSCKKEIETSTELLEKSKQNKIDSLGNCYFELNRFSGTILIAKSDEIIYNKSFGFADYENKVSFSNKTAFKVGEITELVTSNLINSLVSEGKLQLTDKVSKYLKEVQSNVTVNDILNKTNTSKLGYNTLGQLIEQVSGKSYQENIELYSKDLNLENMYFKAIDTSAAVGYLYHNSRGKGLELQRSPSIDLAKAYSSKGLKSTARDLVKIVSSNPKRLVIHGYLENDGFSYSLVNNLKNKTLIIVLSNQRHPVAKEMTTSIGAILEGETYRLPLPRKPYIINTAILKDFSGYYAINEHSIIEVRNSNDSLFVLMGPNKVHLIPQSSNQFYMEQMDASMRFLRDSSKVVHRVVLLNGFMDGDQEAILIKK